MAEGRLTAADLARIERRHERVEGVDEDVEGRLSSDPHCADDLDDWPCDTIRLVAVVRAPARAIHDAGRAQREIQGDDGEWVSEMFCAFCGGLWAKHAADCIARTASALVGEG